MTEQASNTVEEVSDEAEYERQVARVGSQFPHWDELSEEGREQWRRGREAIDRVMSEPAPRCSVCGGPATLVTWQEGAPYRGSCKTVRPDDAPYPSACVMVLAASPSAPEPMQLDGRTLTREERALWDRCIAPLASQVISVFPSAGENVIANQVGRYADALIRERRARGTK